MSKRRHEAGTDRIAALDVDIRKAVRRALEAGGSVEVTKALGKRLERLGLAKRFSAIGTTWGDARRDTYEWGEQKKGLYRVALTPAGEKLAREIQAWLRQSEQKS